MANNLLLLPMIGAISWVFLSGPPEIKPTQPSSRVAASDVSARSAAHPPELEARQAPVPLVRSMRASPALPAPSAASETPAAPAEQDDLDRRAAKAAAEQDGYKRVSIVGKAGNGAWRAKGFRGATEILLTVDGTGRVSMD
jgi:hypothetical protein